MSVISKGGTSPLLMTTAHTTMTSSSNQNALESASRTVEKMLHSDSQVPTLLDELQAVLGRGVASVSGHNETDYSSAASLSTSVTSSLLQLTSVRRSPLPTELVEHFSHMQFNCMMGLFPEIQRAWLTIDSDIYVWRYEDARDLAYFDGLADTILSVALVQPKPGIFQPHVEHLLCLATPVEIVLLGVCFTKGGANDEMYLLPEPLFSLSTDSTYMTTIVASQKTGRVFLGGRNGCLYEFAYWADDGWFGRKAQMFNHSTSAWSFLIPSFINNALYQEESIDQIVIDDSRNILYTRSDKGSIQLFDLGADGLQISKIVSLTQQSIVQAASRIALHVDKSNLSPIIGIAAIDTSESVHLGLLAVSASGVRFYFSTSESTMINDRPHNLMLQHVRLPPGFAASSSVPKPSNVHMCYYKSGAVLLSSPQTDESDFIWLLLSDLFPLHNVMMEAQSIIPLDGKAWAMDEVPQPRRLMKLYMDSFGSQNPPVAVIQHAQTARKFVVISAQGTHIILKLRPVDHLCKLLIDNGGPDNDVIKAFFHLHTEVQAIAICLILACSQTDTQVQDWATKAFFLYGGEPRFIFPQQARQGQGLQQHPPMPPFTPAFNPRVASTPAPFNQQNQLRQPVADPCAWGSPTVSGYPGNPPQQETLMPEMEFSFKHQGLYLYFSRLIRPIWLSTLIESSGDENTLQSKITSEEAEWIMIQLVNLRIFVEKNSHSPHTTTTPSSQPSNPRHMATKGPQQSHNDALLRERQSLLALQHLLNQCVQVLGLWKILCEHHFHSIAKHLSLDDQRLVLEMSLRDLIISTSGQNICSKLVQCIIQLYLSDSQSTDAISNRLQETCPSFYNTDDAIASKAHEMIIAAKELPNGNIKEREKLLSQAVQMCKGIATRINLEVLVSQLSAVHFYEGALELTLASAAKRDPQGLALHFYKSGEPVEDKQGMEAFMTRTNCYKLALDMMGKLYDTSASHPLSQNLPRSPGPPPLPDPNSLPPAEAGQIVDQLMKWALESDDQLFHAELYQWLTQRGQIDRLLEIRSPFIEDYLIHGTKKHQDSILIFDLLWKYYEKTKAYAAAAKILAQLAERQSPQIDLTQRLEYLSRAIMCVKSGELAGESSRIKIGELLHDLEEKMEVARVQLMIVNALKQKQSPHNQEMALRRLNSQLIDISELYQTYAEPFDLWECQLAILQCAGHHDVMLVETVWSNIIESELAKSADMSLDTRIKLLSSKMKSLGTFFSGSQKYFPLDFIVHKLEVFSCEVTARHQWVFEMCLTIGIPLPKLLDTYNSLYLANDPVWLTKGSPHHLLHVMAKILGSFADNPAIVSYNDRRQFTVFCLDIVGQCLGNLYAKHDANLLVQEFREIQAKLERL